jgi:hypothetical protein
LRVAWRLDARVTWRLDARVAGRRWLLDSALQGDHVRTRSSWVLLGWILGLLGYILGLLGLLLLILLLVLIVGSRWRQILTLL